MMLECKPNFEVGRIVRKEALENLRDFPRDLLSVFYKDFTSGILWGFDLKAQKNGITVCPGILKHQERFLVMTKEKMVNCPSSDEETTLQIVVGAYEKSDDFNRIPFDCILRKGTGTAPSSYELCRFRLEEGARLRYFNEYQNMKDIITAYNTINPIYKECAGRGTPTFSPEILRYFSNSLLQMRTDSPYDILFAGQCLNSDRMERDVILHYIANRLNLSYQEYDNYGIYEKLTLIAAKLDRNFAGNGSRAVRNSKKTVIE